ncbi:MAG TPA: RNA polymerase sigma factor [Pyrinomonadaceae bacterium]|nr:RNA polymerase sigma factor [Pyrinomonadaceae bacterium]
MSDELLLERAKGGDQAAFEELYERHRNAVFRFAYRLLGSVETAEDVTHDCFLSLIRRPEGFEPSRGGLRTYLYSAARNLSLKHFRSAGRTGSFDELPEEPTGPARDEPLHRLLDGELSQKVKEAVVGLPPLQREALVLFEYEGLALSEIADIVGSDIGAVKARLHRAREGLRTTLRAYLNSALEIATLEKPL